MNDLCSYLYKMLLTGRASIKMTGKNRFKMVFPQTIIFGGEEATFNMIVEFKIFRGKLKAILKDMDDFNDERT